MKKLAEMARFGSPPAGRCLSWLLRRGRVWCCMALALSPAWVPSGAEAQVPGLYWQCQAPSTANPQGGYCPVGTSYPLPTGPGINAMIPVAGTQVGVTISSATGLTIPSGATVAVIQAQGTGATTGGVCLYWRDDGTAPTGTAGQALVPNQTIVRAATSAFKAIAASGSGASCTMTVSYYK